MATSNPHTHIRLRDLSELIAGIPYIIGFPPTESLVLYTFRRCPQLRLSSTIRMDLPRPDHVLLVAEEMAAAVARNDATAAIAVVIAENGAEHLELIEMLKKTLEDRNVLLTHASWVRRIADGELWRCYDDPLCTDIVPDPQSSALAAATAVAGDPTYSDREAMAAHLAPDPEERLAYRRNLLKAYRASSTESYTDDEHQADMEIVGHALDMASRSYELPRLTDHQIARLGMALSRTPVRDECLAMALSDETEAAERLWTVLTRGLPTPERAEPAFLLAMSAYLRGSGVIAGMALNVVLEADPVHTLAVLLDYSLQKGVPPDHLRNMLLKSVIKNNAEHTEQDVTEDDPPWETTSGPPTADDAAEQSVAESGDAGEHTEQPADVEGATRPEDEPVPTMASSAPVPPVTPTDPSAHEEVLADHEHSRWPIKSARAQIKPGALSRHAAAALGVCEGAPERRTIAMDPLAAFLPPLTTDRRGPG